PPVRQRARWPRAICEVRSRSAQILPHDVEAEEGEARTVIDAGDGRGRGAVELADEEAFRIGRGEAGAVGEARIPAFGCCPVHRYRDFVRPHRPDAQVALGGRSCRWTHEPNYRE